MTYKTAWRMGHQIRKFMGDVDGDPPLGGHVEADETYVGGRRSGGKRGRGAPGKTVVFGMVERGGDVMTRIVPNARKVTLERHILDNIKTGATVSTDELTSYAKITLLASRSSTTASSPPRQTNPTSVSMPTSHPRSKSFGRAPSICSYARE